MKDAIAAALIEAWESGNSVSRLPEPLADPAAAEDIAAAVLDGLALLPCGLRIGESGLIGPMVSTRFLPPGAVLAAPMLHHARVAPALVGVLAEDLSQGAPVFARLHPALDVSGSRWAEGPATPAEAMADLANLGHVVLGKGRPGAMPAACALVAGEARARPRAAAAEALLLRAAEAACAMGGLPAGAVLVAVLDGRALPAEPGAWAASWTGLGRAAARISAAD